jgi:alcohol dehydrogenase (cytochrome c)
MGDKILLPANNAHAVAINARNGEIVWDTPLSDVAGHATTSGTIVVGDKMLQGMTGCGPRQTDGCYISAIDVNSGKRLWRFQTRAQTGPEANTWGSLPMDQRVAARPGLPVHVIEAISPTGAPRRPSRGAS